MRLSVSSAIVLAPLRLTVSGERVVGLRIAPSDRQLLGPRRVTLRYVQRGTRVGMGSRSCRGLDRIGRAWAATAGCVAAGRGRCSHCRWCRRVGFHYRRRRLPRTLVAHRGRWFCRNCAHVRRCGCCGSSFGCRRTTDPCGERMRSVDRCCRCSARRHPQQACCNWIRRVRRRRGVLRCRLGANGALGAHDARSSGAAT